MKRWTPLSLLLILMNPLCIAVLYHCYKGFNGVILQGVTKYGTGHRIVFFKSFDEFPDFLTVSKPCSWFHFPTIHHFMFFVWIQNRKFSRNGAQQSHLLNKRFKKGALLQKFYTDLGGGGGSILTLYNKYNKNYNLNI